MHRIQVAAERPANQISCACVWFCPCYLAWHQKLKRLLSSSGLIVHFGGDNTEHQVLGSIETHCSVLTCAGLAVGEAGQATALVVDAEVTSYLMMGALSPGLKRHSVTLFEGERLTGITHITSSRLSHCLKVRGSPVSYVS